MSKHLINPDLCTACTTCVVSCPVTEATRKFRGPKATGPALERMRLSQQDRDTSLEYCSNCKNCDISCPSGVPISTLNMLARAKQHKNTRRSIRDQILSHGEKMAKLSNVFPGAKLANIGMTFSKKLGLLDMVGIEGKAPLPPYASQTFLKQFKTIKQVSYPDKVVFFPGCFINYNDPQVGLDFVEVMQKNGYEVVVDEAFVCCGSPLVVGGFLDEAHDNAVKNCANIKKWIEKGYPVITCCTSCGLMLKQEYQELFHLPGTAENARNIYDVMEFLQNLHDNNSLNTNFGSTASIYLYHAPCHLRAQGFGLPALDILGLVPGLKVENVDAGCCGISGNYGFKADKYAISQKIGERLFKKIKESKVDTVISDCGTCRLQIAHGGNVRTAHPVTVLKAAYAKAGN
ncbi:anaerobic glycerol-3-phosphate dehydrogenase subunit C [Dendrosporobacter sp. 1207_IL3150]|uniref:anaerobic glycerol-3-phosphate dehydrogenase subunit C n=1 Tax=Dendrosporobacter sp. 1207_IL3150 TaxID=3084054 RepID=UPI002FDB768A